MIAKCGKINIDHWAHVTKCSDEWDKDETEWHLRWKAVAPVERTEQVIKRDGTRHRADIVLSDGQVVELQAGSLPVEDIEARERFYGDMVWVFRCYWESRIIHSENRRGRYFNWKHAHKAQTYIKKPLWWDLGSELWLVQLNEEDPRFYNRIIARKTRQEFENEIKRETGQTVRRTFAELSAQWKENVKQREAERVEQELKTECERVKRETQARNAQNGPGKTLGEILRARST